MEADADVSDVVNKSVVKEIYGARNLKIQSKIFQKRDGILF